MNILLKFYLFLFLFYGSSLLFSILNDDSQMIFLGREIGPFGTAGINLALGVFLIFLYFWIKKAELIGLFLAIFFHSLFFANSLLMILGKTSILQITGLITDDYSLKLFIIWANLGLNTIIIYYLLSRRAYFIDK